MEGRRLEEKALYRLNIEAEKHNTQTERAVSATQVEPLSLWQKRFGHLNYKTLLKMASIGSATGLALFNNKPHSAAHCRGCLLRKMHRAPFSSTCT
jgi:hypothetical protein